MREKFFYMAYFSLTHSALMRAHSLRSLCSMRRWQYWKAFSLRRSFGGSSRLEEEVAETIETTEPSTSDRSSVKTCNGSGIRGHDLLSEMIRDKHQGPEPAAPEHTRSQS